MMENNFVEIVSMAEGIIIGKDDGNFDRNCGIDFNTNWNAVYIRHDNGSIAWYGHMKKNSLTNKQVGERVSTDEFLGIVGSLGASTGPHLHLEIYNENNKLIDPWFGPGNPTQEIITLVNELQPPEDYEVEFNISSINKHMPSGVYFII